MDGGTEEIVDERRYDLTEDQQLQLSRLVDFTREQVRTLYRSSVEIQQRWVDPEQRSEIIDLLAERGIDFDDLKEVAKLPDVDPFDLLCHIAFNEPALTYKQRAEQLKRRNPDIFTSYGEDAKAILETLLDKYAEHGVSELDLQTTLKAISRNTTFWKLPRSLAGWSNCEQPCCNCKLSCILLRASSFDRSPCPKDPERKEIARLRLSKS